MKVTQVLTYYPPYPGGIENSVHTLVKRLTENGLDVHVVTAADPPIAKPEKNVHRVPILFKVKGKWGEVPFCPSFLRTLNSIECDVIHAHMPAPLFPDLVTINEMIKTNKTPVIIHYRLYQDYSSFIMRLVSQAHNRSIGNLTFKKARKIIVPNTYYKRILRTLFEIPAEKISVINNAVNDEVYDPSKTNIMIPIKEFDLKGTSFVLFAGRLVDHKGVEDLITAFRRVNSEFPQVQLLIAGNGPLEPRLKEMTNVYGLTSKVRFLGAVPQSIMPHLYSLANIFVLPSLFECSSNVLREGLVMEKPVIATRVGDAVEVITDHEDGLLINPSNPAEMAESMCYLLSHEQDARRMGKLARINIQKKYNWNITTKQFIEIYKQVLS